MRVLYRDEADDTLCVAEVTGTTYYPDEEILEFSGDCDFGVRASAQEAEKIVNTRSSVGKADVTGYESCDVDFGFEDDEFDEDDEEEEDDEDLDDALEAFLNSQEEGFHVPKRYIFPKKQ